MLLQTLSEPSQSTDLDALSKELYAKVIRQTRDAMNLVEIGSQTFSEATVSNEPAAEDYPPVEYLKLAVNVALPSFAFGFIDNFLMVVCGTAIDTVLQQAMPGANPMYAAGIGNAFSDVAGVLSAEVVDAQADQLLPDSQVSKDSPDAKVQILKYASGVIGIISGCLAGLIPIPIMEALDMGRKVKLQEDLDRVVPRIADTPEEKAAMAKAVNLLQRFDDLAAQDPAIKAARESEAGKALLKKMHAATMQLFNKMHAQTVE